MIITEWQKERIEQVVNVFETGSKLGNYGKVTIYADGKNGSRQITYGRSQTTEQGNLRELLKDFCDRFPGNASYAEFRGCCDIIRDRLPKVGRVSLVNDGEFVQALRVCGGMVCMRVCQDAFFERRYWLPAVAWAEANGFELGLSMLVIYDSFIHSGGILSLLRNRFPEVPPSKGGRERAWVTAYVRERRKWLLNKGGLLAKTVYRMDAMQGAMSRDNWDLSRAVNANGVMV